MTRDLDRAVELIERHDRCLIACHVNPDGDALGSMLGLALFIGALGSVALADDCGCDVGCCDDGCGSGCNSGCGGLVADLELTFLRYFQEGGVTDMDGAPAEFRGPRHCRRCPRRRRAIAGGG